MSRDNFVKAYVIETHLREFFADPKSVKSRAKHDTFLNLDDDRVPYSCQIIRTRINTTCTQWSMRRKVVDTQGASDSSRLSP